MKPKVPFGLGHVRALRAPKRLRVVRHLTVSPPQIVLTPVVVQGPPFTCKEYKPSSGRKEKPVRGRPYMMSAKFSGFLTPSPLVCI